MASFDTSAMRAAGGGPVFTGTPILYLGESGHRSFDGDQPPEMFRGGTEKRRRFGFIGKYIDHCVAAQ
ncbi:MAG: hypothetical protein J7499_13750 [Sphingopyxis sp.]|nr:hypothetical protein [Sphingopyxis sp.]